MPSLSLIIGTFIMGFILHKVISALRIVHSIGYLPAQYSLFGFRTIWFYILPRIKGINLGRNFVFEQGYEIFERSGIDAYVNFTFWPRLSHVVYVADAAAIKDLGTTRRFPKPLKLYELINLYGHNIVASEGELWKKYRKISAPSFSEKNNKLVWEETLRVVDDLMDNMWEDKDAVVDHGVDITLPLALLVIGAAGFGQRISWEEDANAKPDNHQLTFRDALHTTASKLVMNLVIPEWAMSLFPTLRKIRLAREELRSYMREMIRDRLGSEVQDRHDLFSSLIHANKEELEGVTLTEEELMGNIFIFLIAGHETTAHTLSFTFALLALYPDIQEKLYQHIKSVVPDGRRPTYEDMPSFTYVMAVYNESLRMFSPVPSVSKVAPEDTSIMVGNCFNDELKRIPLPKGTQVALNVPGVQYNPRYWENPKEFMPERFLGNWNKDALIAFSVGPRACLGRKFNETEGVAALASIFARYRVEIKEEPKFKHETFQEKRARILTTTQVLTVSPKRLPLVFRRRA